MATKEDILEQLVEEFLIHRGYFIRHNIKYLPDKSHPDFVTNQDSNHSDIDVLALHPMLHGPDRIWAVSCKSWQSGFNPKFEIEAIKQNKKIRGREAWRAFRELVKPKWSEGFRTVIEKNTGSSSFTYVLAVAKVNGDKGVWEKDEDFLSAMNGNPIKIITFREMLSEIAEDLDTTLAATEVGRMLQMFKSSGVSL
ncbi:MAG: hypothetical protein H6936_15775 [Burkholderiales bacterium]|nr:hypothetical protein [Nitrosomonas sp.]MCP5276270.1 hypothetical protein [Burkholderiales bacterium]